MTTERLPLESITASDALRASNVNHPRYREAAALRVLLTAAANALNDAENCIADWEEAAGRLPDLMTETVHGADAPLRISVGGYTAEFILGGPQFQALVCFIDQLAAENGYSVDYDKQSVIED